MYRVEILTAHKDNAVNMNFADIEVDNMMKFVCGTLIGHQVRKLKVYSITEWSFSTIDMNWVPIEKELMMYDCEEEYNWVCANATISKQGYV